MDDWRELACMAIGAALVDKGVRKRLADMPLPLWPLSMMAEGIRDGDGGRVWRGLERGYGLENDGHERVIDRVLDELQRKYTVHQLSELMKSLVDADATGASDAVDRVITQVGECFKGGRSGE